MKHCRTCDRPHDTGRHCTRCKAFQPWDAFALNRSARDGHQSECRPCSAQTRREYFERNAEAIALRYAERLARSPGDAMKECRKCGETKPMLAFYAHRSTKDRRANYCMDCQRAATREWNAQHAEQVRARNKAYAESNGKTASRGHRKYWLKMYGLTPETYDALLEQQGGVCAICQMPERYIDARTGNPRRLAVDHDHQTNKVRGLLCGRCNRSIGQFADDHERLARASDYLRRAAEM